MFAKGVPPLPDRGDSELGGVSCVTYRYPTFVVRHVVDPVGDCFAQEWVGEVMNVGADRVAFGLILSAAVGLVPQQFLLLGVHRHHRIPRSQERVDQPTQITELAVPVRVRCTFGLFRGGLQRIAVLGQQTSHQLS